MSRLNKVSSGKFSRSQKVSVELRHPQQERPTNNDNLSSRLDEYLIESVEPANLSTLTKIFKESANGYNYKQPKQLNGLDDQPSVRLTQRQSRVSFPPYVLPVQSISLESDNSDEDYSEKNPHFDLETPVLLSQELNDAKANETTYQRETKLSPVSLKSPFAAASPSPHSGNSARSSRRFDYFSRSHHENNSDKAPQPKLFKNPNSQPQIQSDSTTTKENSSPLLSPQQKLHIFHSPTVTSLAPENDGEEFAPIRPTFSICNECFSPNPRTEEWCLSCGAMLDGETRLSTVWHSFSADSQRSPAASVRNRPLSSTRTTSRNPSHFHSIATSAIKQPVIPIALVNGRTAGSTRKPSEHQEDTSATVKQTETAAASASTPAYKQPTEALLASLPPRPPERGSEKNPLFPLSQRKAESFSTKFGNGQSLIQLSSQVAAEAAEQQLESSFPSSTDSSFANGILIPSTASNDESCVNCVSKLSARFQIDTLTSHTTFEVSDPVHLSPPSRQPPQRPEGMKESELSLPILDLSEVLNAEELESVPPTETARRATAALHRALHALSAADGTSEEEEAGPAAGKGNANESEENSSSRLLAVAQHPTSGRKVPKMPTVATPAPAALHKKTGTSKKAATSSVCSIEMTSKPAELRAPPPPKLESFAPANEPTLPLHLISTSIKAESTAASNLTSSNSHTRTLTTASPLISSSHSDSKPPAPRITSASTSTNDSRTAAAQTDGVAGAEAVTRRHSLLGAEDGRRLLVYTPRFPFVLPAELWLEILAYLPRRDLVAVARVCRAFYPLALDASLCALRLRPYSDSAVILNTASGRTVAIEKRTLNERALLGIGKRRPARLKLLQCFGDCLIPASIHMLFDRCSRTLQSLECSGCQGGGLEGDAILKSAATRCPNLRVLDVSWTRVSNEALVLATDRLPELREVSMSGCTELSAPALGALVRRLGTRLERLELEGCFAVDPEFVALIAASCSRSALHTLNLAQCYKLTDASVAQLVARIGAGLRSLNLSGCKQVRDGTVRRIAKHCPQLERLALANCASLTDAAVAELATYVRAIGALDVSNCRLLGNRGVGALAAHCTALHTLDVSSTAVDSHGLTALAQGVCAHSLRTLKLNFLHNVSESAVAHLVTYLHRLESLHLFGARDALVFAAQRAAQKRGRAAAGVPGVRMASLRIETNMKLLGGF